MHRLPGWGPRKSGHARYDSHIEFAGETVQSVRCSPHKSEDLSSVPSGTMCLHFWNWQGPWNLHATQPNWLTPGANERPYLKSNIDGEWPLS